MKKAWLIPSQAPRAKTTYEAYQNRGRRIRPSEGRAWALLRLPVSTGAKPGSEPILQGDPALAALAATDPAEAAESIRAGPDPPAKAAEYSMGPDIKM